MSYTKQTWLDGEENDTPFSAARGNHIEDGIAAAHDDLAAATTTLGADIDAVEASVATKAATSDPRFSDARTPLTHTHTKAEVGLSNVDNTSDAGKPVSTAVAGELAGKANTAHSHPIADLTATGTKDDTTFLRGDGTWSVPPGGTVALADLPPGSVVYMVQNGDGSWPNRRTSRTDILGIWLRIVAASGDPAAATSPAVNGAYTNDVVVGV